MNRSACVGELSSLLESIQWKAVSSEEGAMVHLLDA